MPNLGPGDSLLLERGCTWKGPLHLTDSGSESAPITLGAYGSGANPVIESSENANVLLDKLRHVIVENISTRHYPNDYDERVEECENALKGWRIGLHVHKSHHVTLRNLDVSGSSAGIHIADGSSHVTVSSSDIYENIGMWTITQGGAEDVGAIAVNQAFTSNNLIQDNDFWGNESPSCDFKNYATGELQDGSSLEFWSVTDTRVIGNRSRDVVFSELGSSKDFPTSGIVYDNNVVTTTEPGAIGIIIQGHESGFGSVLNTTLTNNTFDLRGSQKSQGMVWGSSGKPCSGAMTGNKFFGTWKAGYFEGRFNGTSNEAQGTLQLFKGATWNNLNACG